MTSEAAQALVTNMQATVTGVTALHDAMQTMGLKELSFDAAAGLIAAAGGMDKLGNSLATYYDRFYSADEKTGVMTKNIASEFAKLGITMPAVNEGTRAWYRSEVERLMALDQTVAANAQATAGALALAGAVDQIAPAMNSAADEVAAAAEQMAQRVKDALSGLGDTRFDLENQLLTLQGLDSQVAARVRERDLSKLTDGLSAADAAQITAAYDYNKVLEEQVRYYQNAQDAASQAASAAQSAADEQARAAEQIRSAWQGIADSIFGEVQRIRGLTAGHGAQSLASAQAGFSIAAAQASAGDQNAAKLLPELSRTLLTLAEANATTLQELRRYQGRTAATLENVGMGLGAQYGLKVPSFDVGTNVVPQDMLAMVHKNEAIIPASYNPAVGSGVNSAEVLAELRAMRAELAELKAPLKSIDASTDKAARTLVRVTHDGEAMQTEAAV
jgi:hypothetical protein